MRRKFWTALLATLAGAGSLSDGFGAGKLRGVRPRDDEPGRIDTAGANRRALLTRLSSGAGELLGSGVGTTTSEYRESRGIGQIVELNRQLEQERRQVPAADLLVDLLRAANISISTLDAKYPQYSAV